ncbi:MAG: glycosyltransferase [Pseudomonadota bacterium]
MHICITLCTVARPVMLADCLRSIMAQHTSIEHRLSVVIVENSDEPACRHVIAEMKALQDIALHYFLEPERGIPLARNRSVEEALNLNADWLAFIDDDETLDPGWLDAMLRHALSNKADVYTGPVVSVLPAKKPDWMEPLNTLNENPDGYMKKTAATNNTLVHRRLFLPSAGNMRFDPDFRYTGGSDDEFFKRARASGFRIMWVNDAVVRETVPMSRFNMKWHLERIARVAANEVAISYKHKGTMATLWRYAPKCVTRALLGRIEKAWIAMRMRLQDRSFEKERFSALRKIASSGGMAAGLMRKRPEPYKVIEGH